MSQSPGPLFGGQSGETPAEVATVDDEGAVHTLLNALDDDDCRAILDATDREARSARELSKSCDLPMSTVYRKLEMLVEADLLAERTRIRRSGKGKHASEYTRAVEEVVVSVGSDGDLELRVFQREVSEGING